MASAAAKAQPAYIEDIDDRGHAVRGTKHSADLYAPRPADSTSHISISNRTYATLASSDSAKLLPTAPDPPKDTKPAPVAAASPIMAAADTAPRPQSPDKKHRRSESRKSKRTSQHVLAVYQQDDPRYQYWSANPSPIDPVGHLAPIYYADPSHQPGHPSHYYPPPPPLPLQDPYAAVSAAPYPIASPPFASPPIDAFDPRLTYSHRRRPMSFHAGYSYGMYSGGFPDQRDYSDHHIYADDPYQAHHYSSFASPYTPNHPGYADEQQGYFDLPRYPPARPIEDRSYYRRSYAEPLPYEHAYPSQDAHGPRSDLGRRELQSTVRAEKPRRSPDQHGSPRRSDSDLLKLPREKRSSRPSIKHMFTEPSGMPTARRRSKENRLRSYTEFDASRLRNDHRQERRNDHDHEQDLRPSDRERKPRSRRPSHNTETSARTTSTRLSTSPGDAGLYAEPRTRPSSYYAPPEPEKRSKRDSKDMSHSAVADALKYQDAQRGGPIEDIVADALRQQSMDSKQQPGLITAARETKTVLSRANSSRHRKDSSEPPTKSYPKPPSDRTVKLEISGENGRPPVFHEFTLPANRPVRFTYSDDHVRDNSRRSKQEKHDKQDKQEKQEKQERTGSRRRSPSQSSLFGRLFERRPSIRSRASNDRGHDEQRSRRHSTVRVPIHEDSRGERREEYREYRRAS